LLLISMPMAALAAPVDSGMLEIDYMSSAPGGDFDIFTFVGSVINWLFYALLVMALIMLILVGYHYVTTGGKDPTKVANNMQKLGFILLGIAIALLAKGLIYATCSIVSSSGSLCKFW
jgi:hypothetical protein